MSQVPPRPGPSALYFTQRGLMVNFTTSLSYRACQTETWMVSRNRVRPNDSRKNGAVNHTHNETETMNPDPHEQQLIKEFNFIINKINAKFGIKESL